MTPAWRVASENSIRIANNRSFKAELVNIEFDESICNYCDESKLKEQNRARKGHFSARGKGRIVHGQGSSGKMDSPQSSRRSEGWECNCSDGNSKTGVPEMSVLTVRVIDPAASGDESFVKRGDAES
jgi:hypothetical protein